MFYTTKIFNRFIRNIILHYVFFLGLKETLQDGNYDKLDTSKHVDDILMLAESVSPDNLSDMFKNTFAVLAPSTSHLNNNYIVENANDDENSSNKPIRAAVQSDPTETFEIASGLKNYATVNTADPIPTQLSYNIGTENVENGKDGETLNDTQMELEENSIITEIENAAIDLLDIERNNLSEPSVTGFDVEMFGNEQAELLTNGYKEKRSKSPNVKIISVQEIVPSDNQDTLNKQIYMPEALQMSLACDEEAPSTWIDVMNLMNMSPIYEQSAMVENSVNALPTTIQSYIDLRSSQVNLPETQVEPNYYTGSTSEFVPDKSSNMNNVLKDLTAEADICKCIDCKCDPYNSCHGCNQTSDPGKKSVKSENGSNKSSTNDNLSSKSKEHSTCCSSDGCNCCNKASCCGSKIEKPMFEQPNNNCTKKGEDCCVVVCLKTLDQLRQMLTLANGCYGFQNLNLGCLKSSMKK